MRNRRLLNVNNDWLSKLKAGDPVIVCNGKNQNRWIETVKRVTPTGIVVIDAVFGVCEIKFRNGVEITHHHDTCSFPDKLEEPTKENLQAIADDFFVECVVSRIDELIRIPSLISVDQWKRINSFLDEELQENP